MKVKLVDGAPRSNAEAVINVSKNGNTLELGIDGTVAPVVIEFYGGKVRLRVYGEDPTVPVFMDDLPAIPAPAKVEAEPVQPVAAKPRTESHKPVAAKLPDPPPVQADAADDELAAFDAA